MHSALEYESVERMMLEDELGELREKAQTAAALTQTGGSLDDAAVGAFWDEISDAAGDVASGLNYYRDQTTDEARWERPPAADATRDGAGEADAAAASSTAAAHHKTQPSESNTASMPEGFTAVVDEATLTDAACAVSVVAPQAAAAAPAAVAATDDGDHCSDDVRVEPLIGYAPPLEGRTMSSIDDVLTDIDRCIVVAGPSKLMLRTTAEERARCIAMAGPSKLMLRTTAEEREVAHQKPWEVDDDIPWVVDDGIEEELFVPRRDAPDNSFGFGSNNSFLTPASAAADPAAYAAATATRVEPCGVAPNCSRSQSP